MILGWIIFVHPIFLWTLNISLGVVILAIIQVKVKPNSKQQLIQKEADGHLMIHLKSPPVDGKANQELIKVLAKQFNIPKSEVKIKSGLSSKHKLMELPDSCILSEA